jgi:3'-phosphoadenosine 5'-phosphosulfate sulfotransferase (PAPS reductase)/FAD synthetase
VNGYVPDLFAAPAPDLRAYDLILVNSSAGKDSQAMLDYLVELADAAGVRARLVVVHCDLGRVEWPGTPALAAEHAAHYGLRFEVVSNPKDLVVRIRERRMWPDSQNRYCTSEQKTGQVKKVMTRLVAERIGVRGRTERPVRILNCLGLRASESPARAKKPAFGPDDATNGRRHVDRWLPIHAWSEADVWARVRAAGTRPHPAYALGMPRLSCCFCVLSSKRALMLAARHNPELAAEYVQLEAEIGHRFRLDFTIADIVAEARETAELGPVESWNA